MITPTTPITAKEKFELEQNLSKLNSRSRAANYKNKLPKLPKNINALTLQGFRKRLSNWENGLVYVEKSKTPLQVQEDPQLLSNYFKN